ncbi:MAG: imine reductase family protein [Acidimicrobiales bacterium]
MANGAAYLDGSVMTFSALVRSEDCQVLVSGDPVAFDRCNPLLDAIAGDVRFLGSDPTGSAVVNSSGLGFVYTASHAFLSAAAMCDAAGAPLDLLADVVAKFTSQMPPMFEEFVEMIRASRYDGTNLRLASGAENLQSISDFGRQVGVETDAFEVAGRTFTSASEAGHGVNVAAAFETLRHRSD